jgi:hypothetical protein
VITCSNRRCVAVVHEVNHTLQTLHIMATHHENCDFTAAVEARMLAWSSVVQLSFLTNQPAAWTPTARGARGRSSGAGEADS